MEKEQKMKAELKRSYNIMKQLRKQIVDNQT
jgi:hypothetical protein